jgi:hypothetical protein
MPPDRKCLEDLFRALFYDDFVDLSLFEKRHNTRPLNRRKQQVLVSFIGILKSYLQRERRFFAFEVSRFPLPCARNTTAMHCGILNRVAGVVTPLQLTNAIDTIYCVSTPIVDT